MEKKTAFTQIPNEILDRLCRSDLTAREIRVLLYIIRNTCGYHHDKWQMSNSFIANALGLDRSNISKIVNSLEKKGLLLTKCEKGASKVIEAVLQGVVTDDHRGVVKNDHRGVVKNDHRGVVKNDHTGVVKNDHRGVVTDDHRGVVTDDHRSVVTDDHRSVVTGNNQINKEENKEKNNNNSSSVVDHSNGVDWAAWRRELGME